MTMLSGAAEGGPYSVAYFDLCFTMRSVTHNVLYELAVPTPIVRQRISMA
jgi:hypothetical protein